MTSTPHKRNATCPTCGSDDPAYLPPAGNDPGIRVACLDQWHDEGTAHLPAEGYDWRADLDELAGDLGSPLREALAAYVERLERVERDAGRLAEDYVAKHTAAVRADRDRYKAEAERWERVARVLAQACEGAAFLTMGDGTARKVGADAWLAWAEKEADGE